MRLVLTALLLLSGCGSVPSSTPAPPPEAQSLAALAGLQHCVAFDWMQLPGSPSPRSLIRVPVHVGGERRVYQFDTGAYDTYAYADSAHAASRGWPLAREGRTLSAITDLGIGPHAVPDASLILNGPRASGAATAAMRLFGIPRTEGTLGLSAFEGTVTLIDYPAQRLCILDAPPEALDARTAWSSAVRHADGRVLVSGRIGGLALDSLLFDTGSSTFALTLDRRLWREATGRAEDDPGTERTSVSAWGEQIVLIGAPAPEALEIGAARLAHPMLYTRGAASEYHARRGYGGVLGNVPFWDGGVLLDLRGDAPRFGIVR